MERRNPGLIDYYIIDDDSLREINSEFLEHHYYTDVITFDYSKDNIVNGEIYISADTVRSNSQLFNKKYSDEIRRVMVHGLLHLLGYVDGNEKDRFVMTKKEDYYLENYRSEF